MKTPQPVPPTLGTQLQKKIENYWALKFSLEIQQLMGVFHASMLEAFNNSQNSKFIAKLNKIECFHFKTPSQFSGGLDH